MTQLQSEKMALSAEERGWLPWFGKLGKLRMGWAYRRNLDRIEAMEQAFESFAETRNGLLIQWAEQQWQRLDSYAELLADQMVADEALLQSQKQKLRDVS